MLDILGQRLIERELADENKNLKVSMATATANSPSCGRYMAFGELNKYSDHSELATKLNNIELSPNDNFAARRQQLYQGCK